MVNFILFRDMQCTFEAALVESVEIQIQDFCVEIFLNNGTFQLHWNWAR